MGTLSVYMHVERGVRFPRCPPIYQNFRDMKTRNLTAVTTAHAVVRDTNAMPVGTPITKYHVNDVLKDKWEQFTVTKIEAYLPYPWSKKPEVIYWLKDKHGREQWGLQSIVEGMERTYDAEKAALARWKASTYKFALNAAYYTPDDVCTEVVATFNNGKEAFEKLEKLAKTAKTEVVFENGTEFGAEPACWAWGVNICGIEYYLTVEG